MFVDAVRRYIALDRELGFKKAITECIKNDILRDYLQYKSKKVLNMLIGEYNYDTDIAVRCEEAGRIAFAQGSYKAKLETFCNFAYLFKILQQQPVSPKKRSQRFGN